MYTTGNLEASTSTSGGLVPTPTVPLVDRPRPKSHAKKQPAGHIPRPRNAFILFRCDFVQQKKIPASVESDHRNISRIAGRLWSSMTPVQKAPWTQMAALEKIQHEEKHPGYRYTPAIASSLPGARLKSKPVRSKRDKDRPDAPAAKRRARTALIKAESPPPMAMLRPPSPPSPPPPAHHQIPRRRSSSCPPPGAVPLSFDATAPLDGSFKPWDEDDTIVTDWDTPVYRWEDSMPWTEDGWNPNEPWSPAHAPLDALYASSSSSELASALGPSQRRASNRWTSQEHSAHRPSLHRISVAPLEPAFEPAMASLRRPFGTETTNEHHQLTRSSQDDLSRRPSRTTFWRIPEPGWDHGDLDARSMTYPPMSYLAPSNFSATWNVHDESQYASAVPVPKPGDAPMASLVRPMSSLQRDVKRDVDARALVEAPIVPSQQWSQPTGWQPKEEAPPTPEFYDQHGQRYTDSLAVQYDSPAQVEDIHRPHGLFFTDPFSGHADSPQSSSYTSNPMSPLEPAQFSQQQQQNLPLAPHPVYPTSYEYDHDSPYSVPSSAVNTPYTSCDPLQPASYDVYSPQQTQFYPNLAAPGGQKYEFNAYIGEIMPRLSIQDSGEEYGRY